MNGAATFVRPSFETGPASPPRRSSNTSSREAVCRCFPLGFVLPTASRSTSSASSAFRRHASGRRPASPQRCCPAEAHALVRRRGAPPAGLLALAPEAHSSFCRGAGCRCIPLVRSPAYGSVRRCSRSTLRRGAWRIDARGGASGTSPASHARRRLRTMRYFPALGSFCRPHRGRPRARPLPGSGARARAARSGRERRAAGSRRLAGVRRPQLAARPPRARDVDVRGRDRACEHEHGERWRPDRRSGAQVPRSRRPGPDRAPPAGTARGAARSAPSAPCRRGCAARCYAGRCAGWPRF